MANRLADETIPYLSITMTTRSTCTRVSGGARPRECGKTGLVSIGYSACHWCHCEHESSRTRRRGSMNENSSGEVDREERPDVDALYGAVRQ